jgi:hypothetical protein
VWKTSRKPEPGKHYYFAKVTQADGNLTWSAPVWVTVAEGPAEQRKNLKFQPELLRSP